jgi:hypothetical protein
MRPVACDVGKTTTVIYARPSQNSILEGGSKLSGDPRPPWHTKPTAHAYALQHLFILMQHRSETTYDDEVRLR